ncbi:hypothetical protein UlMin_007239 [Ulmus minor]
MPAKAESARQASLYAPPWWRGAGNDPAAGESISKFSVLEYPTGSLVNGAHQPQATARLDGGANFGKEMPASVASQSDANNGLAHHAKSAPSFTPPSMAEHLDPNSQMELVGHSIVLTPYSYGDPHYGGMLSPYGQQAMVPPPLYGMYPGRMPLPLDMEEEPVYVNAKQYNGILRRRQSRAKAELEKKVTKSRKPYLHESRHLHAMRRARGCGGRFLNTKKQDNSVANPESENKSTQSTINGNSDSSNYQQEASGSMVGKVLEVPTLSYLNGNNSHGLSSGYNSRFGDSKEGDCLVQGRESMRLNGSARGVISIK